MRKERLFTLIGIFIVGAAALSIYGVIFFYESYLKEHKESYVMFFKGSLEGLEAKSIVSYRGVKIGEVTQIEVTENKKNHSVDIPVYVQFFVERTRGFERDPIGLLIEKGYVADISQPNFISGVASIKLIKTEKKIKQPWNYYRRFPVFPTAVVTEKFTTLDEALKTAKETMEDISNFINSEEMQLTIKSLKDMANSVSVLSQGINRNVSPVTDSLIESMQEFNRAAHSTQNLMDYLARYPESLIRGRA